MVGVTGSLLSIFLVREIIFFVLIGILINELLDKKRKNRSDVGWFLSLSLLWIIFLGIMDYGVFTGDLHFALALVAALSFLFMIVGFGTIIVRNFEIINKVLAFSTVILAIAMFVVILLDRYNFSSVVLLPMAIASLIVTVLGLFTVIDFLIKTSDGNR